MRYFCRLASALVFAWMAIAGAEPLFAQGTLIELEAVNEIQGEIAGGRNSRQSRDRRNSRRPEQQQAAQPAANSGGWPKFELNPGGAGGAHAMKRGPGHYLSITKILACWILFAIWVVTMDWLNHDC